MSKREKDDVELLRTWALPSAATLGSSVRAKGLLLELRARLPASSKKLLVLDGGELVLAMPAKAKTEFHAAAAIVSAAMKAIESLPVIPREIEDILTIKPGERHRWLADGRLPSAGTRTVRLAGRAKKITFHVFDANIVEELLNSGVVDEWRDEDKATAAENRRRAAYKAKLTRSLRKAETAAPRSTPGPDEPSAALEDWDAFGRDGLLR
ncbi:hypothetical protein ASG39_20665 [Rhizobium sp. Leaf371]|uniref:hypothetical protein n=1 Tax=Rhizobium sp. Leaf371 TaxID=1736355 RepID=UPI000714E839|nr:hypothetical protein [Rhizobium sp. Leaf371]KQS71672.1 hypothetical protein ASG39_20665 [Rhizobium sp. Leaf371]